LVATTTPKHCLLRLFPIAFALIAAILVSSCTTEPAKVQKSDESAKIAGTWVMKSRTIDDRDEPVSQRLIKLHLRENGTFRAEYSGDESQQWITAGRGGFSYEAPFLTLFWDSGQVITLLVREATADKLLVHHGRNLAPLKEQEPDETFQRQKETKGPTRQPS
jgi:hypothetical protein